MIQRTTTTLTVRENRLLGGDLYLLSLAAPAGTSPQFHFHAGQFAELKVAGKVLPRPFSILPSTERDTLRFLIKRVGAGTQYFCGLRAGDELGCTWPLGSHFDVARINSEVLLVGGGVGVAPMLAAFDELSRHERPAPALFGFRSGAEANAVAELIPDSCDTLLVTEDGSLGLRGRVTDPLQDRLPGLPPDAVVLCCGPDPMMKAVAAMCHKHGLRCLLSLETYMGCGVGICAGCAVKRKENEGWYLCCQHGPVFEASLLEEYR